MSWSAPSPRGLSPFALRPIPVARPWGGRRLAEFGVGLPAEGWIGESWELVDLPDEVSPSVRSPQSVIASGVHAGATLASLLATDRRALMGPIPTRDGRFPLLFKLLDARQNLSVQVHPPVDVVRRRPHLRHKTESWYVLRAEPGAELMLDLSDGVTIEDVARHFGSPSFVDLLARTPVRAGDFVHLPAGLVHSLGAGVVVAEVQTPSDTTFRIYDWSEEYGREGRELHRLGSLESIRIRPPEMVRIPAGKGHGPTSLVRNDHYWITEHRPVGDAFRLADEPGPRIVLAVSGRLAVGDVELSLGRSAVVPATSPVWTVSATPGAVALEIGLGLDPA